MKTMMYKGISLTTNTASGILKGEGAYAVLCGNKKFVFDTIADFKRCVNGIRQIANVQEDVPYLENGKWGYVPIENFKNFVLGAK